MAMGKRKRRAMQASMWVATQDLRRTAAHPFYTRLNQIFDEHDFDGYVEGLCERFYATEGRPGSLLHERKFGAKSYSASRVQLPKGLRHDLTVCPVTAISLAPLFILRRASTIARLALSRISDAGSGTGLATMLSRPTGLPQHGVAGFESVIRSVSMICVELEFTVAKLPKVFGTIPARVNTGLESRSPVTKYGIVVRLE
jgi:hypothetical protein